MQILAQDSNYVKHISESFNKYLDFIRKYLIVYVQKLLP